MPRIIRMKADRRGALGDNRYRDFAEGRTYVEAEQTGPEGTVSPFLTDQFLRAGEAVEVDADKAPAKAEPPAGAAAEKAAAEKAAAEKAAAEKAAASDSDGDDKPLAEKTVDELKALASELDIEGRSKLTTKDDLVAAIEEALAKKAAATDGE